MAFDWKVYQYAAEILVATDGPLRTSQIMIEYIQDQDTRFARASQIIIEYIQDQATRFARCSQIIIEVAEKIVTSTATTGYLDEASSGDFAW